MHEKQGAERAQDEKPGCLWVAEGPSGGEGIRLVTGNGSLLRDEGTLFP